MTAKKAKHPVEPIEHPFHPIIFVRGYAGNDGAVESTAGTPYMGFNDGATKVRQHWKGNIEKVFFESPLLRLIKDYNYSDIYRGGAPISRDEPLSPRSVIIYRYYDQVSHDFGTGDRLEILDFARGLSELIHEVREHVCGQDKARLAKFRVYLVAHSMGGLICRSFLQHPDGDPKQVRGSVDKMFTYATPHNGIDMRLIDNVPGFFTRNNADNFNRGRMAQYLGLSAVTSTHPRVDTLGGMFDANRCFTLVGTNHNDYLVGKGIVRSVVGPMSDGLVRIANATLRGAPRAFVHRSHSGQHGIVNSEEGFQNLARFLFGDVRIDGVLRVKALTLPPSVREAMDKGKEVRASYHFECIVAVRGARYELSRRTVQDGSAVFRKFDELLRPEKVDRTEPRHPHLFSTFLSVGQRTHDEGPLVFSVDLRVRVPEYEIDGFLFFDDHIEGSSLWNKTLYISASPPDTVTANTSDKPTKPEGSANAGWTISYAYEPPKPGHPEGEMPESTQAEEVPGPDGSRVFHIPIRSSGDPGIDATLELRATPWNQPPE